MPNHDNEVASQRSPILDAHGPDPVPADIAEPLPGGAKVDLVLDGDHAVQWLGGDIDASNSGRLVDIGSLALADPRVDSLVVDLSAVTFLDSSGLGAMVQLRNQARTAQKQRVLTTYMAARPEQGHAHERHHRNDHWVQALRIRLGRSGNRLRTPAADQSQLSHSLWHR